MATLSVMDPMPGQKYVEFSKDGGDGNSHKATDSGLDVEHKPKRKYVYLSRVEHPAPAHNLNVGDRVIALNGKLVESYADLDAIRETFTNNNVICLVVDPTMLR